MKFINNNDCFAVFGARGMAGSAISRSLTRFGYDNQLKPTRSDLDLLDLHQVQHWFSLHKPSVVILAAAKVGGIHANSSYPSDFLLENLKIQTNVIESAWHSGVKRLLFLGSSCIYPKFSEQPIKEETLLTGPLEQTNQWYAIAKIAGIKLCESLRIQHNFDAISLMPTNLYGSGDNYHVSNSHVLPAMIRRFYEAKIENIKSVTCWGTGTPLREFLHVDDLGDAAVFALENWKPSTDCPSYLNVGTGVDISIKELANIIASVVDYSGSILWDSSKPDGTYKKLLDTSRITNLGWYPRISLVEGLKLTFSSFKHEIANHTLRT